MAHRHPYFYSKNKENLDFNVNFFTLKRYYAVF
jgi:hypothetical protein